MRLIESIGCADTGTSIARGADRRSSRKPTRRASRRRGLSVVDAVEVDEEHRLVGAVRVGDARAQAAGHERQVRVGVAGLDRPLCRVEIVTALEPVVLVAGALGKQGPERLEIRRNVLRAQTRGQAAVQKARRSCGTTSTAAGIGGQRLVLGGEMSAEIDEVEPRARRELDRQVECLIGHSARGRTGRPN